MADGSIDIEVKLNGAPAESEAAKIGQKLGTQVSKGVESATAGAKKSTQQAVNEIGGTLTAFGAKYTKAVTLPIAAAAVATGASAVKIDTALTGVRKTVDGTEEEYEALKQAAIDFSQTNPVDPATILDIQALGAQLGYQTSELAGFSETIAGIGASTNLSFEEAATELAQFSNIMGMAHDETKNYGSTIVALGNNFATTEADISHMAMRIAGAGKQIGLTEADVLGLATALSSMGIEAEAGGTAISTIMANIDKEVATNGKNLETWAQTANMSVDEFVNAWGTDAVGALSSVLIGMDAATEAGGNMSVMLDELGITSIRQTDTFKRLASNSEFLGKAVETANDAWRENTALDKEVENRNNSMAAQLQILWNKVQAVAIEVGEPLMKALLGIIDAADPLIDALASGAKAFSDLDEDGQKAVLLAVAVVAGFGPMVGIIGKVTTGITNGSKSWRAFSENLKVVKTNLMTANTALDAQSKAVKTNTTAIKNQSTATKTAATTTKTLTTATKTATTATKTQTVATKESTTAMKLGTVAANGLKAALRTIAPVAILTVAIELFTALADAIGDASEKAAETKKRTEDVANAISRYSSTFRDTRKSLEEAAAGADTYSRSLENVVDEANDVLDKQSQLSDQMNELWSDTGNNAALIENYVSTIEKLSERYDDNGIAINNNAREQADLIAAVEGLNGIMGTSYKVIDAEKGILSENLDIIKLTTQAYIDQAKVRAAQETLVAAEKENLEVSSKLKDVRARINEITEDGSKAYYDLWGNLIPLNDEHKQLIEQEKELSGSLDANNTLIGDAKNILYNYSEMVNTTVEGLQEAIAANDGFAQALENAGIDAGQFAEDIYSIGVSAEDLAQIMAAEGDAGIQGFVNAYQQGLPALVDWAEHYGYEIGNSIEEAGDVATEIAGEKAEEIGQAWADGLSSKAHDAVNAAQEVTGLTTAELAKMANDAQIEGEAATVAFAMALADGSITAASSAEQIKQAVDEKLKNIDGVTPVQDAMNGMVGTFNDNQGAVSGAAGDVEQSAQGQLNLLDGETPSSMAMGDWVDVINQTVAQSRAGAKANTDTANTELNRLDGATPSSREMGNWTSNIKNAEPNTRSAAKANADAASQELQRDVNNASSWGSHLGNNFANGIKIAVSATSTAAKAVANAAKAVLKHSIPKEGPLREGGRGEALWGEHLVQNFVSGILSSRKLAKSAAMDVAQDIDDVFAGIGKVTKDGIIIDVKFDDPNIKISDSMMRSLAAFNVGTLRGGAMNTYQTNTQNITFAGNVQSPDIMAREFRMQQLYGLAGKWL